MSLLVPKAALEATRHRVFTWWGVDWLVTKWSWVHGGLALLVGLVVGLLWAPGATVADRLVSGLGYALLLHLALELHAIGHVIGGKLVAAPMYANLLTSTTIVNLYNDAQPLPSRVHLARALGGPLFNALIGLIALALNWRGVPNHFLLFFALTNLLMVGALVPIPTLDGEVVVRELRDWKA
jgi:hypothetical protein